MTEYFLTVPHDTATEPTMESMAEMDPVEMEALIARVDGFNTALKDAGAFRYAGGLHPPSTAKTVEVTSGETVVRDEPFVQATEYVGGFWVIDAADLDAALTWAGQASEVLGIRIEVREMQ